jgi:uncharacterized membrane protein YcaP (DUF421 family)
VISVVRTAGMWLFLLAVVRLSGKRALAEITVFDFVTLLVISEGTQQALTGNDFSLVNGMLIVLTLVVLSRVMDFASGRSKRVDRILNDQPLILIDNGRPIDDRLEHAQVDEADILENARGSQGLERMDQIKWAVLERDGSISIIPREPS